MRLLLRGSAILAFLVACYWAPSVILGATPFPGSKTVSPVAFGESGDNVGESGDNFGESGDGLVDVVGEFGNRATEYPGESCRSPGARSVLPRMAPSRHSRCRTPTRSA